MGFKSINKQLNNTTYSNNTSYKIGGLIFESEDDYLRFNDLEDNINIIIDLVKNKLLNINDVYINIMPITVKEEYPDACEELYGIFIYVAELLRDENDVETKVAKRFFSKIKVIEFCDSDYL